MIRGDCALVFGASRGIGFAITRQLLMESNFRRIYATYRDTKTAADLLKFNDHRIHLLQADVTQVADLEKLGNSIRHNGDHPDLVIHSAGILHEDGLQPEKALSQCRQEALLRMFQVNSIGPLLLARTVIPLMPKSRPAHFAVLSAMVGSIGDNRLGGWYGYRASKAALNQLMRTLAIESRRSHPQLCISAIHPGTTDTSLSKPFQPNVRPGKLYKPSLSASRILGVVSGGTPERSGRFVNWDGETIPW